MTKPWVLLVCAVVTMTAPTAAEDNECLSRRQYFCPDVHHNSSGNLAFVDHYPEQPMWQSHVCFDLSCCTGDQPHVNTTWYKWLPDKNHWCLQQEEAECIVWEYRYTSDGGQTLVFDHPGSEDDTGRYKCVATDGQTTLSRTFIVKVIDCKDNPSEIVVSKPSDLQASLESTFTQACQGGFGCRGAVKEDNLAWWSYVDEQGRLKNLTVGRHGRYSVDMKISDDETKKSAVLTIEDVKKEDFDRTFVCQLKMRDLTDGFNFTLSETGRKTAWRKYLPLIVVLSFVFAASVLLAVLTCTFFRPVVLFKLVAAANKLPKRGPGHAFDVMLISREDIEEGEEEEEEEEKEMLNTLTETLQGKGYTLHKLLASRSRVARIDDIEKCVSIIFIISTSNLNIVRNYLQDFDHLFSVGAEARTNMIFVPTRSMSKGEWEKLSEDYRNIYPHAPKLCTVATWPGEKDQGSCLRHANFWCQIQRFLPKPHPGNTGNSSTVDPVPEQAPLTGDTQPCVEV